MLSRNIETFLECDKTYEEADTVLFGAPFDSTTSFRPGTRFGSGAIRHESFGLESYSPYQDRDLRDARIMDSGDLELPFGNTEEVLREIEERAGQRLLAMLPEGMRRSYREIFEPRQEDAYLWKLVKAADKLSAYIKCIEEEQAGNREFAGAKATTLQQIHGLQIREAELFLEYFIDSYGKNLDELTGGES